MRIGKYCVYFRSFDWFLPLLIFLYTVYYYTETIGLPHPEVHNLLIRPVVYAIVVLTALYFISHLRWDPAGESMAKAPPGDSKPLARIFHENRRFLIFLLQTIIYLPLISLLGFALASAAYMVASMLHLGVRNIKVLLILPLVTVIGLVLMFESWLTISVPKGIFGF